MSLSSKFQLKTISLPLGDREKDAQNIIFMPVMSLVGSKVCLESAELGPCVQCISGDRRKVCCRTVVSRKREGGFLDSVKSNLLL